MSAVYRIAKRHLGQFFDIFIQISPFKQNNIRGYCHLRLVQPCLILFLAFLCKRFFQLLSRITDGDSVFFVTFLGVRAHFNVLKLHYPVSDCRIVVNQRRIYPRLIPFNHVPVVGFWHDPCYYIAHIHFFRKSILLNVFPIEYFTSIVSANPVIYYHSIIIKKNLTAPAIHKRVVILSIDRFDEILCLIICC